MHWSTGCVADSEQRAKSTGSTSQLWSTNSGTQPLTNSCGFPAPYLMRFHRGPRHFLVAKKCPALSTGGAFALGRGDALENPCYTGYVCFIFV